MVSLCPRPAPRHVRAHRRLSTAIVDVSPARAAMASLLGRALLLWLVLVLVLFKWEWEGIRWVWESNTVRRWGLFVIRF